MRMCGRRFRLLPRSAHTKPLRHALRVLPGKHGVRTETVERTSTLYTKADPSTMHAREQQIVRVHPQMPGGHARLRRIQEQCSSYRSVCVVCSAGRSSAEPHGVRGTVMHDGRRISNRRGARQHSATLARLLRLRWRLDVREHRAESCWKSPRKLSRRARRPSSRWPRPEARWRAKRGIPSRTRRGAAPGRRRLRHDQPRLENLFIEDVVFASWSLSIIW